MTRAIRILLYPVSIIYGMVVFVRNRLYDWNILKSEKGAINTVVVGNISAGGTGKTPHVEYLLKWLSEEYSVAFLSRGYGRKTKGFMLADGNSTAKQIGDEPLQIAHKFSKIKVAVSESRLFGLTQLKQLFPALQLGILDDAYQHRSLKGDLYILLTDYNLPWWKDAPLPTGQLRDNIKEKRRADLIVVTKCPATLSIEEMRHIETDISPAIQQSVFYSSISYGEPVHLSGPNLEPSSAKAVIGFAGIAHPQLFEAHIRSQFAVRSFKVFADHHIFSHKDLEALAAECDTFGHPAKVWVTTEKDAMRLKSKTLPTDVSVFYVPIEIRFLKDENLFKKKIGTRLKNLAEAKQTK